jgi:hypothetical protein
MAGSVGETFNLFGHLGGDGSGTGGMGAPRHAATVAVALITTATQSAVAHRLLMPGSEISAAAPRGVTYR